MQITPIQLFRILLEILFIFVILYFEKNAHKQIIFIFLSLLFIELIVSSNKFTNFSVAFLQF